MLLWNFIFRITSKPLTDGLATTVKEEQGKCKHFFRSVNNDDQYTIKATFSVFFTYWCHSRKIMIV